MTERKIEIINKTVYNTEDLHEFYRRAAHSSFLPGKLVVGYYNPTPKDKLVDPAKKVKDHVKPSPWKHVRYKRAEKHDYRKTPRLGIVKPELLYDSPLQQLAAASEDQTHVPLPVLCELFEAISAYHHWTIEVTPADVLSPDDDYWDAERVEWLKDFKLRYSDRRKRRTPEQRLKEMQTKLRGIYLRWDKAEDAVRRHSENLAKAEVREAKLQKQYYSFERKVHEFKMKHGLQG